MTKAYVLAQKTSFIRNSGFGHIDCIHFTQMFLRESVFIYAVNKDV